MSSDPREIEEAIRVGGLAPQKSLRIKRILEWLQEERGRLSLGFIRKLDTGEALRLLTSLPGVGPKTARVVLLFAFGRDVFPVDTHILRVSKRLGVLTPKAGLEKAHEVWASLTPAGESCSLHLNLIRLGREICRPRRPLCDRCPIAGWCPRNGVTASR